MSATTSYSRKWTGASIGLALALALSALLMIFPARGEATVGYFYEPARDPAVSCATGHYSNGVVSSREIFVHTPWMDSVGMENTVSYQPMLHQWNGFRWVFIVAGPELHGGQGFLGLPEFAGFTIHQPGKYYRASIVYRWYSPYGRLLNEEHVWAGTHQLFKVLYTGQKQVLSGLLPYCYMP